ncbi:hypothetical protein E2C01_050409 [Portunus trituberculatus]|uniref:Uncharacterized protein n=1 Tax=Portunus trituberculatus TaxID=210409 RepID=A0A5B7GH86_PORTR|nr:hypothetical protein [Portunus trituberculatus]
MYFKPTQPRRHVFKTVFSSGSVNSFVEGVAQLSWEEMLRRYSSALIAWQKHQGRHKIYSLWRRSDGRSHK